MNSLEHEMPMLPEMPGFDDGMVNIQELIRIMAESIVNEIMDAQAEDACADGNQRNGYRARELTTSDGKITFRIPKPMLWPTSTSLSSTTSAFEATTCRRGAIAS